MEHEHLRARRQDGDLDRTRAAFDFLGINHYTRQIVSAAGPGPGAAGGIPGEVRGGEEGPKTEFGWEVWPRGFHDVVMWAGRVDDTRRTDFCRGYLGELHRAIGEGADVRGYHAWSPMDNFEWAEGYTKRFGLVHVDFGTQKRTVKESGRWYARVAAANALVG